MIEECNEACMSHAVSELDAKAMLHNLVEDIKSQMYEIAGIQEVSMDMENCRSAAAVIALEQARDAWLNEHAKEMISLCTHKS
jgi:hypothetical protein